MRSSTLLHVCKRLTLLAAIAFALSMPGLAQGAISGSGNGLQFDGIDDYVSLGEWSPGTTWTIEAWVMRNAPQEGTIPLVGAVASCNDWELVIQNGQFGVAYKPSDSRACSATLLSGVTAVTGERYHVAATNDGSVVTIYINGERKGVASVSSNYSATSAGVMIGGNSSGYFQGVIDEVSIWNVALTEADMFCSPNRMLSTGDFSNGCIAYYTFNSIAGSTVSDESGHGHGGTVHEAVPVLSKIALGPICTGGTIEPSNNEPPVILGSIEIKVHQSPTASIQVAGTLVLAATEGDPPPGLPAGGGRYWVINAFGGAGSFLADVTFDIGTPFPPGLGSNPSLATLYTRPSTSIGPWTLVGSAIAADPNAHTVTFAGFTHFSQYIVRLEDSRLPVELTSFDLSLGEDAVELNWRTASEADNAGFEVQRALATGGRAPEFQAIASYHSDPSLAGLGTSSNGRTYSFSDPRYQLEPGATYLYRLVDVSGDGIRTEHPAQSILIDAGTTPAAIASFKIASFAPNPARDEATVSFELASPADVTMNIFAENGTRSMVAVGSKHYDTGSHSQSISLAELPSGSYTLVVTTGTQSRERRFTVVR